MFKSIKATNKKCNFKGNWENLGHQQPALPQEET